MEETPPLAPAPYDPERWLRRWTTAAGGLLAATVLIPRYEPDWGTLSPGVAARRGSWQWPWDTSFDAPWFWLLVFAPHILGIVAIVGVRRTPGKFRAVLIALPAIHGIALSLYRLIDFGGGAPALLLVLAVEVLVLPVAAATAAGAHLARRYPRSTLVRRRSRALGVAFVVFTAGSAVAAAVAVGSFSSGIRLDSALLYEALLTATVMSYGVLCALRLRGRAERFRIRILAAMTRLALPLYAVLGALAASMMWSRMPASPAQPWVALSEWIRWMGLEGSRYALGALAICAWIEPRMHRGRLDADVIEPIFA
jgi:hypothetical protein